MTAHPRGASPTRNPQPSTTRPAFAVPLATQLARANELERRAARLVAALQADMWDDAATVELDQAAAAVAELVDQTTSAATPAPVPAGQPSDPPAGTPPVPPAGRTGDTPAPAIPAESPAVAGDEEPGDETLARKECSNCGATKALEEFHRHSNSRDGRHPRCKACRRAERRKARAAKKADAPAPAAKPTRSGTPADVKPPVVHGDNPQGPPPLAIADPIRITVDCPEHGQVANEVHDSQTDAPLTAAIAARIEQALHEAGGCTQTVTHAWKSVDTRARPDAVKLHQPSTPGGQVA
jgi:hypothetical protein